ncbi:MAG: ATP-binding protein [Candidatus Hydrogenedentes bacterium]|nr:ATP-binding protein [Candidatus Hydrogenedentota bacterium]
MIQRNLIHSIREAMTDTPVILVNGARQTGKSTLVQACIQDLNGASYQTLDDATVLAAAQKDPAGFLSGFSGTVVLDEIQRAPDLFPAIKLSVDRDRRPGRFVLTGSANVLMLPRVSESLAGRMEVLTLWPFSAGERAGQTEGFLKTLMDPAPKFAVQETPGRAALLQRVIDGGYPEAVARASARRRDAWYGAYITTILQRDVRDLANIEQLASLPRLLQLLAARATSLANYSEIARALKMPQSTLKRYMTLLEMTYLVQFVPPWSQNLGKRLVKSPKLVLCDTGLMAYLLGIDGAGAIPDMALGALVENYVAMELRKQLSWHTSRMELFHFRERTGKEVDFVLETPRGQIAGIEVKASSTVGAHDFKHLNFLQDQLGDRFQIGVVLYLGDSPVKFGDRMHALPLNCLWNE